MQLATATCEFYRMQRKADAEAKEVGRVCVCVCVCKNNSNSNPSNASVFSIEYEIKTQSGKGGRIEKAQVSGCGENSEGAEGEGPRTFSYHTVHTREETGKWCAYAAPQTAA